MNLSPDEIQIAQVYAPTWLKLLKEKESDILGRIYGQYRAGNKDLTNYIAEYCVIRDQINQLVNLLREQE